MKLISIKKVYETFVDGDKYHVTIDENVLSDNEPWVTDIRVFDQLNDEGPWSWHQVTTQEEWDRVVDSLPISFPIERDTE